MSFFEIGIRTNNYFRRNLFNCEEEIPVINSFKRQYSNTDIYRSIFTYESQNFQETKIRGPLYFDFDCDDHSIEKGELLKQQVEFCIIKLWQYLRIPRSSVRLYFSGNKGFHLIIPEGTLSLGYQVPEQLVRHYKALAELLNNEWKFVTNNKSFMDLRIYDSRRVFRITNTINSKSNLYKIPVYDFSKSYADIRDMAKQTVSEIYVPEVFIQGARDRWDILTEEVTKDQQHKEEKRKRSKPLTLYSCVQKALQTPVGEGNRNNAAVVLANALFQLDLSTDEIYDTMRSWNSDNLPPLPDNELLRTIMSADNVNQKGWTYGCTSMKELGFCDNSCKARRTFQ